MCGRLREIAGDRKRLRDREIRCEMRKIAVQYRVVLGVKMREMVAAGGPRNVC